MGSLSLKADCCDVQTVNSPGLGARTVNTGAKSVPRKNQRSALVTPNHCSQGCSDAPNACHIEPRVVEISVPRRQAFGDNVKSTFNPVSHSAARNDALTQPQGGAAGEGSRSTGSPPQAPAGSGSAGLESAGLPAQPPALRPALRGAGRRLPRHISADAIRDTGHAAATLARSMSAGADRAEGGQSSGSKRVVFNLDAVAVRSFEVQPEASLWPTPDRKRARTESPPALRRQFASMDLTQLARDAGAADEPEPLHEPPAAHPDDQPHDDDFPADYL